MQLINEWNIFINEINHLIFIQSRKYFYVTNELFSFNEFTSLHATNSLFLHLFIQETKHLLMNFELFLFNKVNIKYMLTET